MAEQPDPLRITKRDVEQLKYQRELMRRAGLTAPAMMLSGEDFPIIRRFAMETFMQMRMINPEAFQGKTVDDWERAIKQYISTRRPEFKEELLKKLRARYKEGKNVEPSQVIVSEAMKEMPKSAEAEEFASDILGRMLNG